MSSSTGSAESQGQGPGVSAGGVLAHSGANPDSGFPVQHLSTLGPCPESHQCLSLTTGPTETPPFSVYSWGPRGRQQKYTLIEPN